MVQSMSQHNMQLYMRALLEALAFVVCRVARSSRLPAVPSRAASLASSFAATARPPLFPPQHANNIIHRDIKPNNFLYKPPHTFCLVDFGLASVIGSDKRELRLQQRAAASAAQRRTPATDSVRGLLTPRPLLH